MENEVLAETTAPPATTNYDLPLPDELSAFMRTGWRAPDEDVPPAAPASQLFAARRQRLKNLFPDQSVVIPTGSLKVRNNDCDYEFRPETAFAWLTGFYEPDAVLILSPTENDRLYLRPRSSRESDEFFRSRLGELWVGPRKTLAEWSGLLGLDCHAITELPDFTTTTNPATTSLLRGVDQALDIALAPTGDRRDDNLATALSELRLVKDDWEIEQLVDAVDATILGFEDVVRAMPADRESSERLVDGVFGLRARHDGNLVGYGTIAAAGEHSCTLHWWRNDGPCRPGDLLLLDAGVENRHYYTADVTRTLPISGRFTPVQRRVYELVLAAQRAGIEAIKPGVAWSSVNTACMAVIDAGLREWGLLPASADASAELHRRWTLHGSGHMLGMDVHDCARARTEYYRDGTLEVGHVFTVEPGLYLQPDDLLVPEELRGIGVRIEDDVVVTADGCRNLSEGLPRDPDEIEAWMADLRRQGPRLPG